MSALDVAVLRGGQREATVLMAGWIRQQVLDEGSQAQCVEYECKHAAGTAWAYWLRRVDDGQDPASEPLTADGGTPIRDDDPHLLAVSQRFGIKIW